MARYQIVFRNNHGGQQTMLVDDATPDGDPVSYMRQPLEVGAKVKSIYDTWIVVDESVQHGLHRFICQPLTHLSPAVPRAGAHTDRGARLRVLARLARQAAASATSRPA